MEAAVRQGFAYQEREIVLRARLDERDDDGCVYVSLHFLRGPRHPRPGEKVYLVDPDGPGCMAEVVDVIGWSARVRPELDGAG